MLALSTRVCATYAPFGILNLTLQQDYCRDEICLAIAYFKPAQSELGCTVLFWGQGAMGIVADETEGLLAQHPFQTKIYMAKADIYTYTRTS